VWEAEHINEASDPDWFRTVVLPRLSGVTLTQIARATGMSTSFASKVRAGGAFLTKGSGKRLLL
jgi:hypothetical protein